MKSKFLVITFLCFWGFSQRIEAQGPPITGDSPIMMGEGRLMFRSLTQIMFTDRGTFTKIPFMAHYLPTSNTAVMVEIPMVLYNFKNGSQGTTLGDIWLMGKYQFYRKDGMGESFRALVQTKQTLPTGKELNLQGMSTGHYEGYFGMTLAYESLKYGISSGFGYNYEPSGIFDKFKIDLGYGLPLLKPSYPVKQINLYFEYKNEFYTEFEGYRLLFAQGVQYAVDALTLEASVQVPLVQNVKPGIELNYSLFFGARYVF